MNKKEKEKMNSFERFSSKTILIAFIIYYLLFYMAKPSLLL